MVSFERDQLRLARPEFWFDRGNNRKITNLIRIKRKSVKLKRLIINEGLVAKFTKNK